MNLGRRCKYASGCNVYENTNKNVKKPVFLIRNVFCNRGIRGWSNCQRYILYEMGENVSEDLTPSG